MVKIGITGGIGSGKSTVCRLFSLLGVPIFNADDFAKSVMVEDQELITGLKAAFGAQTYFEDGSLNRVHLSGIVFKDDAKLALLNSLVHPATFRAYDAWAAAHQDAAYIIKEAALMFETDAHKRNDWHVIVTAPEALRIQRAMNRDGVTEEQVRNRMHHQLPEEEKVKRADFIIYNDEQQLLIPQVTALHQQFLERAGA